MRIKRYAAHTMCSMHSNLLFKPNPLQPSVKSQVHPTLPSGIFLKLGGRGVVVFLSPLHPEGLVPQGLPVSWLQHGHPRKILFLTLKDILCSGFFYSFLPKSSIIVDSHPGGLRKVVCFATITNPEMNTYPSPSYLKIQCLYNTPITWCCK